jgi:hypothetical protein
MPYSLVEFTDFLRTYSLRLQGRRVSQVRGKHFVFLNVCKHLLGYMASPEDGTVYRIALAALYSESARVEVEDLLCINR